MREGRELLANTLTIIGGRPLELLPAGASGPWVEHPVWPEWAQPFTDQQERCASSGTRRRRWQPRPSGADAAAGSDERSGEVSV